MIDKKTISNIIPISIHDGSLKNVKWIEDKLFFSIEGSYKSKNYKITLCFHGVSWIRNVCDEKHDGYVKGSQYEEYPLIDRDKLNENYKEFVSYGLLDDITLLGNNVVCVNDIFFFNANSVEVIK